MSSKITYVQPEVFIVNGKRIAIVSGSKEHLKDLTPTEQRDLKEFFISLNRVENPLMAHIICDDGLEYDRETTQDEIDSNVRVDILKFQSNIL